MFPKDPFRVIRQYSHNLLTTNFEAYFYNVKLNPYTRSSPIYTDYRPNHNVFVQLSWACIFRPRTIPTFVARAHNFAIEIAVWFQILDDSSLT